MIRSASRSFAFFAPLVSVALSVTAPPAWSAEEHGIFSVIVENDRIADTDRHYTNGMRLGWLSPEDEIPEWADSLSRRLPLVDPHGHKRVGVTLGQSIFTPDDTSRRDLVRDDRPYAGWLYAGFGLVSDTGDRLDSLELDIGVVGPASFAEDVQKTWHDWIGASRPRGWDNQLDNEPGLMLVYERKWRQLVQFSSYGLGVDVTPHIGGTLGNVFTYIAGGATLRFGEDLPNDFGPPRIRPRMPGSSHFVPADDFGWYLFAGFEGRAVARNIFLDGNTFTDSHSVSKKPLVADFQVGVAVTFRAVRLVFTHVFRTREFDGQPRADRFGAVSLSARF